MTNAWRLSSVPIVGVVLAISSGTAGREPMHDDAGDDARRAGCEVRRRLEVVTTSVERSLVLPSVPASKHLEAAVVSPIGAPAVALHAVRAGPSRHQSGDRVACDHGDPMRSQQGLARDLQQLKDALQGTFGITGDSSACCRGGRPGSQTMARCFVSRRYVQPWAGRIAHARLVLRSHDYPVMVKRTIRMPPWGTARSGNAQGSEKHPRANALRMRPP